MACRNVRTPRFGAPAILFIAIDFDVLSNVAMPLRFRGIYWTADRPIILKFDIGV